MSLILFLYEGRMYILGSRFSCLRTLPQSRTWRSRNNGVTSVHLLKVGIIVERVSKVQIHDNVSTHTHTHTNTRSNTNIYTHTMFIFVIFNVTHCKLSARFFKSSFLGFVSFVVFLSVFRLETQLYTDLSS